MSDNSGNSKRIAKNTLLLYFRMFFLMIITLYTSRVNLNALGVEDFGIYNVVGGVVLMFSILSGSLSAAISRFLTFELGRGDQRKLKMVFSSALTIQIGLAVVIIVLSEVIGVWYIDKYLVLSDSRLIAAHWTFQFSIITFVVNLISVPYNSAIIAHEKMKSFAWISIYEAVAKLGIAYLILISPIDRLIFYGFLQMCATLSQQIIYQWYCKRNFEECIYSFNFDKGLLKNMFEFAGWNFIGASASILRDQGGNVVLNLFFGPTVNAARGIANRVNGAILGFVKNFMMALNPQITKSYAAGDNEYMFKLIYKGARYSFYLLLILSLPVIMNTHYILVIWLKLVPEHTVFFIQLILIFAMSEALSNPLVTAMLATGKIRNYQIVVGGLEMMNLPTSFILLKLGSIPETIVFVAIFYSQICLAARLYMLKGMINLNILDYFKSVYLNVIIVSVLSAFIPFCIFRNAEEDFLTFLLCSTICLLCSFISILFIGCSSDERKFIIDKTKIAVGRILK